MHMLLLVVLYCGNISILARPAGLVEEGLLTAALNLFLMNLIKMESISVMKFIR
jgi:hypothetical protein